MTNWGFPSESQLLSLYHYTTARRHQPFIGRTVCPHPQKYSVQWGRQVNESLSIVQSSESGGGSRARVLQEYKGGVSTLAMKLIWLPSGELEP